MKLKRLGLVLLFLGLAAGGWFVLSTGKLSGQQAAPSGAAVPVAGQDASSGQRSAEGQPSSDPNGAGMFDKALGLALQGVSLFQGSKGAELWRLKATWAHLSQTGDVINVDMPVVRYLLGEPGSNDFLDVVSQKGRVTDNQRYLTLWGDVRLTRFDEVVTATTLNYDAATRVMVFPEGARLEGPTTSGMATYLTWELGSNTLVGEKGVEVVLKPRAQAANEVAPSDSTPSDSTPSEVTSGETAAPAPVVTPAKPTPPKNVTTTPSSAKKTAVKPARTPSKKTTPKKATGKTTSKTTNRKTAPKAQQDAVRR